MSLHASFDVKQLQKEVFRRDRFSPVAMNPQDANLKFIRDNVELVPLGQAQGCTAAGEAWPYPPGVLLVGAARGVHREVITAGNASLTI